MRAVSRWSNGGRPATRSPLSRRGRGCVLGTWPAGRRRSGRGELPGGRRRRAVSGRAGGRPPRGRAWGGGPRARAHARELGGRGGLAVVTATAELVPPSPYRLFAVSSSMWGTLDSIKAPLPMVHRGRIGSITAGRTDNERDAGGRRALGLGRGHRRRDRPRTSAAASPTAIRRAQVPRSVRAWAGLYEHDARRAPDQWLGGREHRRSSTGSCGHGFMRIPGRGPRR